MLVLLYLLAFPASVLGRNTVLSPLQLSFKERTGAQPFPVAHRSPRLVTVLSAHEDNKELLRRTCSLCLRGGGVGDDDGASANQGATVIIINTFPNKDF